MPNAERLAASTSESLQAYLGVQAFGRQDYRTMARIAFNESIGTDRGEAIVGAMVAHLRQNSILLPSAAVLEKIALVARARARKQAYNVFGRRRHQFSKDRGKLGRDPPNDCLD
jgi:Domain of unknown function (DUF4158)